MLLEKRKYAVLKVTVLYYMRLVGWVGIALFFYEIMNILIPVATVASLSQIILFAILLGLLIVLKVFRPEWYENFRWFCMPGVIFLKSWTSLFFFAYLVQLPAELSSVSPPQIVSWVFQVFFGTYAFWFVCLI